MSFSAVGNVFDLPAFREHLESIPALSWADSVTVHHAAFPDMAMRPKGWTIQHMRNIQSYYSKELGWKSGPHLFTDEDQAFGMTPLTERGVHAKSFNSRSIGVEALGNFDKEDPRSGRGLDIWTTTAGVVAALLEKLNLEVNESTVLFHRDDPKTSKTCPGTRVEKAWFLDLVRNYPLPGAPASDDLDPKTSNIARARELMTEAQKLQTQALQLLG